MTALGSILGVVLFVWGIKHLALAMRSPGPPVRRPRQTDLDRLRERFATSDMSVEDFEAELEREFEHPQVSPGHPSDETHNRPEASRPATPVGTARWEIHIHDAPTGHHLHLHLP